MTYDVLKIENGRVAMIPSKDLPEKRANFVAFAASMAARIDAKNLPVVSHCTYAVGDIYRGDEE